MKQTYFFRWLGVGLVLWACSQTTARAQTPVLRWAFDAGQGRPVNTTDFSGGTLSIDIAAHAAFRATGGVGPASPGVLDCSQNLYGDGDNAAQIRSDGSDIKAKEALNRFVVTMWIKPAAEPSQQPFARLLNISQPDDEKGNPGLYVALHDADIEVGVNGHTAIIALPAKAVQKGGWTFIAFVYDGGADNPYYCTGMVSAVGIGKNGVVLTGSVTAPVIVAGSAGLNTGAPGFKTSPGPLNLDGLSVAVGASNYVRTRAFCGLIDDIRVYDSLLTTAQIEKVRQSVGAP